MMTSYQVDLRVANSETLPDLKIPVNENCIPFEGRVKEYVCGSARSEVVITGDNHHHITTHVAITQGIFGQTQPNCTNQVIPGCYTSTPVLHEIWNWKHVQEIFQNDSCFIILPHK